MTKLLVETTGEFLLQDTFHPSRQIVQEHRPSVVEKTSFIEQRLAGGQIKLLALNLKDEASDEEFEKYFAESEGDIELAISSFVAAFTVDAVAPKKKPTKGDKE